QLEKAIAELVERPEGLHEGIHQARRHIKRVRALYRLIAARVPEFHHQENRRLRDMAHSLATFRDSTSLIELIEYLQENARSPEEAAALARVSETLTTRRDWLARAETDLEAKTEAAVDTCREALAALEGTSFRDSRRDSARLLRKGWQKTRRGAAAALEKCRT